MHPKAALLALHGWYPVLYKPDRISLRLAHSEYDYQWRFTGVDWKMWVANRTTTAALYESATWGSITDKTLDIFPIELLTR